MILSRTVLSIATSTVRLSSILLRPPWASPRGFPVGVIRWRAIFLPLEYERTSHPVDLRMSQSSFYAVAAGRKVGVFRTWNDCNEQVQGFKGARYKKFASEDLAMQFIQQSGNMELGKGPDSPETDSNLAQTEGKDARPQSLSASPSKKAPKRLLEPRHDASSQTVRELHSLRQTVDTLSSSIKDFVESKGKELAAVKRKIDKLLCKEEAKEGEEHEDIGSRRKRLKSESGTGSVETNRLREEGLTIDDDGFVQCWTDGACGFNGSAGAKAGIGVWWNHNHKLNISAPISCDQRHTNNVAEIQAAIEAIRMAKATNITRLCVNTDSKFLIDCMTKWISGWKRNGWQTAQKEPVKNKEELCALDGLLSQDPLFQIKWNHVRGHSGVHGNEQADELARRGAKM